MKYIIIILALISSSAMAQSIEKQVVDIARKPAYHDDRGDKFIRELSDAYAEFGEAGVDDVLKNTPEWYGGVNLYIAKTSDLALIELKRDTNAIYNTVANKISVHSEENEDYTIIVVVSF